MIILELIGRKKFQEISGLSDEEYELLIKNAYISPYSEEDNKSYFFENEAEFTKAKKDEWLREARDMEEWAKENPELDAFQQEEEIDNDNFDSDYIELDRDREVYEEYETRQYGDTQKVVTNDDVTEDDLQTIYDVLGLNMDPDQEDIKDSANQKKNKNTKNHLKKHRQHITQTAMEESLDPNKGTRIYKDGNDFESSIEKNYGSYSHESKSVDSSYPEYTYSNQTFEGYHRRQTNISTDISHQPDYDQKSQIFQKLHDQIYQQNQSQLNYSGSMQNGNSYQSFIEKNQHSATQNYQSEGHRISGIDYSRKENYEKEKQKQYDADQKAYKPGMVSDFESKFNGSSKHYQSPKNSSNISHSSNSLEGTSNKPPDRGRVNPSILRIDNERMANKPLDRGRVNPSIPRIDNERMKQIQQESRNPNVLKPNGPSPLSNGQNKQNNQVEYTKIYGGARHNSRIRADLGSTVIHGTQIEQTDAYQAYRKMKVYGGALTGGAFFGYSAKRAQAFEIRNMQQAGFTRQKLSQIMQDQHILSKTMAESLNKGLNAQNIRVMMNGSRQTILSKYRIDIDKLSDAQLSAFISILKNSDKDLVQATGYFRKILSKESRRIKMKRGRKIARKNLRQELLHGIDAYDAAVLFAKSFRGAKNAVYIVQRSSRFVGRQALRASRYASKQTLKVTGKFASESTKRKIAQKQIASRKKLKAKNKRKLERQNLRTQKKLKRFEKINNIKQAPKRAAGKAFEKVFKKNYSETLVGKVTGKINGVFDRIFSVFDKINEIIGMIIKRILMFVGGVLLLVLVLQLVMAASAAITTTVQSLFETSDGKDVSEKDVMKSAGGEILTALTEKDQKWVENDVYKGAKHPKDVNNKKVYGGTDPETGKKIEITEFGSSESETAGVNVNFYNGNAYSAITGNVVKELLKNSSSKSSRSKASSSTLKNTTSSTGLKKAAGKTTYEGDEVVFASKGSENDGISKTFVGKCMTTGYCAGCNTPPGTPITGSGVKATPGVTVAISKTSQAQWGLSYGSIIYVGGSYYVVEDCGPAPGRVDIYVSDSLTCASALESSITRKNMSLYKVTGGVADVKHPKKITIDGKTYTGVHVDDNGKKKWLLLDGEIKTLSGGDISSTSGEIPTSNAKAILSMGTVYFDQSGYNSNDLLKTYCFELWNASHKLSRKLSEIYQCNGCREIKNYKCNDSKIKNAKGPNGKDYGLLDGIKVKKDSYGDEGCKKYYCNQDKNSWQKYKYKASGCKGTENKRGKVTDAELTLAEISKYPKSIKDEEVKNGSGKINQKEIIEVSAEERAKATADPTYKAKCKIVETYTESKCPGHYGCDGKHSKKYCPGHVDLEVDACIVGIDENEAVQLFQIDPGDNDSRVEKYNQISKPLNGETIKWKHWTEENRDMVHMFFDEDWKDLYGIDIASLEQQVSGVSSYEASATLSSADAKKILDELPENLPEKRRKIIETALSAVGKIPYHFGDKARHPGFEGNNFGAYSYSDRKGRTKKGLDCSHFVDWVYWTAVGNNLGNESTVTLKTKGKETNTLKPGDVMVLIRPGSINHTGIFIGYNKKNQMIFVHESSSSPGNVKVTTGTTFDKSANVTWRNMDQYLK